MKRNEEITIDLKSKEFFELVLKQFDTTQLIFSVQENGKALNLNDFTANLIFIKPNGTVVIQSSNIDFDNNKIIVQLKEDCVRDYGKAKIEIELLENNEIYSSFQLICKIEVSGKSLAVSENDKTYWEKANDLLNELNNKKENGEFDGKSNYEIAVDNGFEGTEEEWLESLKPQKGIDYFDEKEKNEMLSDLKEAINVDLDNKSFVSETGNKLDLTINPQNYIITLTLLDKNNNILSTKEIDLPLETMVIDAKFDKDTKSIILTLQNGQEVSFGVGDLVDGLVSQEDFDAAIKNLQNQVNSIKERLNTIENKVENLSAVQKYRLKVSAPILAGEEVNLSFSYIVGQLEVKYCGHDLIRGTVEGNEEDGEYAEVGEEGSISNKIIVGFDIPVSTSYPRYFDFIVKGGVDNAN